VFRNILIPTDGSQLARKGIRAGVRLAAALGARVSGVCVMLPTNAKGYDDTAIFYAGISSRGWRHSFDKAAREKLAVVQREARQARVMCSTHIVHYRRPWQGILAEAHRRRCDAIVIASHGHGALGGLLLGNETQQLLAHSRIPVLVVR
jgi:nucleotide-binding universal stress UspA family protein